MSNLNEILTEGFTKCLNQHPFKTRFSALKSKRNYHLDTGEHKPGCRYVDFWVQRTLNGNPRKVLGQYLPGENIDWSATPPYIMDLTKLIETVSKERIEEFMSINPYVSLTNENLRCSDYSAFMEHLIKPLMNSLSPDELLAVEPLGWVSGNHMLLRANIRIKRDEL